MALIVCITVTPKQADIYKLVLFKTQLETTELWNFIVKQALKVKYSHLAMSIAHHALKWELLCRAIWLCYLLYRIIWN